MTTTNQATAKHFEEKGYAIKENIYTDNEVNAILDCIQKNENSNLNFRKNTEIFAIRQALNEIPELKNLIFNKNLKTLIQELGSEAYFAIKSIYFDKPETSNWFVPYHQDLTISVTKRIDTENYCNWTKKNDQVAVQPPLSVLENIFTIRIHLDDTTFENGAVKVISHSHLQQIIPIADVTSDKSKEVVCAVPKGGVMLMKPLTLHASTRTINHQRRRVLHIEFSNLTLDNQLEWAEFCTIFE